MHYLKFALRQFRKSPAFTLAALSTPALFASYFAARRATHLDPMVALRHEEITP